MVNKPARIFYVLFYLLSVFFADPGAGFAAAWVSPKDRKNLDVMKSSVVRIISGAGSGTGFAIGDGQYFVTNKHVVEDAVSASKTIAVVGKDKKPVEAIFMGYSPASHDLALLRTAEDIESTPVVFPPANEMSLIRETQKVIAMGYPSAADIGGINIGMEGITTTEGKVTRIEGSTKTRLIQIDAGIEHGNSGGPLFDEWGRVIGINTFTGGHVIPYSFGVDGTSTKLAINVLELFPLLQAHAITPAIATIDEVNPRDKFPVKTALLAVTGGALAAALLGLLLSREKKKQSKPLPSVKLTGLTGFHTGKQFPILALPFWVGRDVACGVVLPASVDVVSRRHCCIDKDLAGDGFTICDNSTNGTTVNGRLLKKGVPEKILPGATIMLKRSKESFSFDVRV